MSDSYLDDAFNELSSSSSNSSIAELSSYVFSTIYGSYNSKFTSDSFGVSC